ncbi:hypothetical protein DN062_12655 [Nitrincola tibetensis]|uniref:DUF4123 domain-containing protein n=2 Tax=Nitrincola tibetensis TaxID=2219697 RepID=A0A364NKY4_9GAMM|nr:hypothetical protein DN062_12655 [Nitrincola tibetensis]
MRVMSYLAWVGQCFVKTLTPDGQNQCVVLVAIWAKDLEDYTEVARESLLNKGYILYSVENAMPAIQWLAQRGVNSAAIALARQTSSEHPVVIGELKEYVPNPDDFDVDDWLTQHLLSDISPLGLQEGVLDKLSVPESLRPYLFAEMESSFVDITRYRKDEQIPPMRTYAILDAARVPLLLDRLESSDLDYQCLFKGEAEQSLKSAAPYLVELHEDNRFTRQLFSVTGMASDLWDKYPGVYVRSRALIDELANHFRRFTKVKNEEGKWLFFRFWESNFFLIVLMHLSAAKGLALMPPNVMSSMLCISMDRIDFFTTKPIEGLPKMGCELTFDRRLIAQLNRRSTELFVFRLRQQFVEQQGMSVELFESVMNSIEKHQFQDRNAIRQLLSLCLSENDNLLDRDELADELEQSCIMPDSTRLNRLVNVASLKLSSDTT